MDLLLHCQITNRINYNDKTCILLSVTNNGWTGSTYGFKHLDFFQSTMTCIDIYQACIWYNYFPIRGKSYNWLAYYGCCLCRTNEIQICMYKMQMRWEDIEMEGMFVALEIIFSKQLSIRDWTENRWHQEHNRSGDVIFERETATTT
jgi:hypothetical protein